MRTIRENPKIFIKRRQRLSERMKGSALIAFAHPEYIRNHHVHHNYRPDSNLYYLTGFEEPESILLFRAGMTPETVLFVRTKNPERETWDGFRFGPEHAQTEFQVDKTYPIEEFEKQALALLKGVDQLYYRFNKNRHADEKVMDVLERLARTQGRKGYGYLTVADADELLGEMRVIKSDDDLANLRKACEISAVAHERMMRATKPGMNERELKGIFLNEIMKKGCDREGYGGIFASGASATTLHYVFNDQQLKSGDLMLIDAGAEFNYFTGDITRTYPINGKFTDEQLEVYEGVLAIQKEIIAGIKPGIQFQDFHDQGASLLTDLMLELGLLSGRKDDIIKAGDYSKYYPHGIGHYLGLDVHDAGLYFRKDVHEPRPIEAGMVFTVEPGIYIPVNDEKAAKNYRGIGVRIEDNILVTTNGYEVLTAKAPKEVAELEKIVGQD